MTTVQLTGGTMEHTVPSNYNENKHGAKVTLHFSAAEGASHDMVTTFAKHVADLARTTAIAMAAGTGQSAAIPPTMPAPVVVAAAPVAPTSEAALPPSSLVSASSLPGAVPPTSAVAPLPAPATAVSDPSTPAVSPSAMTAVSPAGPVVEQPWDKLATEHLTKAASRLAHHGDAMGPMLHAVIRKHQPAGLEGSKAAMIAPENRAAFIAELGALA